MFAVRRALGPARGFAGSVNRLPRRKILPACQCVNYSAQAEPHAIPEPSADGQQKTYPEKISRLVDQIANLTLVEVADLNELLKKRLNIPDVPLGGFVAAGGAAPAAAQEEEEEVEPQKVQTMFTLKLAKFDDSKKVALIKEIKNQLEGMNLVQAKKFVESAPQVVKADMTKDEADKLKAALEAVGGTCEIE